jgi:hypothetical protein
MNSRERAITKAEQLGFDPKAYIARLRIFREAVAPGKTALDFTGKLGIDYKRWSNYERGYPIPREAAWLLRARWPGITAEWLWFGDEQGPSRKMLKRLAHAKRRLNNSD